MPIAQNLTAFNAGELSPLLDARTDIEKYVSGCRELQNFIPTSYGPNMRRPGTEGLGETKDSSKNSRLIPFIYSETTRYQLEFGDKYLRVWMDGAIVVKQSAADWTTSHSYVPGDFVIHSEVMYYCIILHTSGTFATDLAAGKWVAQTIFDTPTPYLSTELRDIQFVEINNTFYLCHPSHPPQQLIHYSDSDWEITDTAWDWPAFLDENLTTATITPSGTTGTITLTTSQSIFAPGHVGAYFQIAHLRSSSTIAKTFAANGSSSTIQALGGWTLNTYGTWAGTVTIDRSYDAGAHWSSIRSYVSNSDRNFSVAGTENIECLLRITFSNRTAGTSADDAILTMDSPVSYGFVKIKTVTATGYLSGITLIDGGSGYTSTPAVSFLGGGGSGAAATALMGSGVTAGRVVGFIITNPGSGYTSPPGITIAATGHPLPSYPASAITSLTYTSTVATADVINDLYATTATTYWAEGAWSDVQGYPRVIAVHEDRVYYAGTTLKPQSIWGSAIDDFQNFRTGILASDAIFFTIASTRQSVIQWIKSKDQYLHVGRESGEGRVSTSDPSSTLSPFDIQWVPSTAYGSKHMQSVIMNDALLFVQGQGRKVRSLAPTPLTSRAAFSAQDVTILSEHITKGEIVEVDVQILPDAILWCIRGDGVLLGMSYDSLSSVVAWHRHETDGEFESVSVIPGTYGDEVWFIVKRTINGDTKRFIERFRPGWREAWEDEDKSEWWYLDCAKRVVNDPPAALVSGLDHLEGETVRVLSDGADLGEYTVTGGEITLTKAGGINIVGLSYDSIMRPMKLNTDLRNGTSQGRKVKIDRVVARLLKSLGGSYSTNGVNYSAIPMRSAQDNMDESPPVFTGDTGNLVDRGNHRDYAEVWLKQSAPMPLTVLSIVAKWTPSTD